MKYAAVVLGAIKNIYFLDNVNCNASKLNKEQNNCNINWKFSSLCFLRHYYDVT